jgi:hypothetical protein
MATKLPTDGLWKSVMQKHQIKDTGLLKALGTYFKVQGKDPAETIKALDTIRKTAATLGRDKEVAAKPEAMKVLTAIEAAVEPAKKEAAAAAKQAQADAKGGGNEKPVDLSKLKSLLAVGKRLGQAGKQAQTEALKDPQMKQANTCAAEGQRAGRALVTYISRLAEIEAAIASGGTAAAGLIAIGRKLEDYTDALMEWAEAIDEYRTCMLHAGQRERARQFEQQAQQARTLATGLRHEADTLKKHKG